jgi:hypothetical protein
MAMTHASCFGEIDARSPEFELEIKEVTWWEKVSLECDGWQIVVDNTQQTPVTYAYRYREMT